MNSPDTTDSRTPIPATTPGTNPVPGHLQSLRVIQFAGPDAAAFLQGYLTCDTDKLDTQRAIPGAFTNLKGRVVANGWVWGDQAAVYMLLSADLTDTVAGFLKMYLNFAKTTLSTAPHAPTGCLTNDPDTGIHVGQGRQLLDTGFDAQAADSLEPDDLSEVWLAHCISADEVLVTAATSGTLLPQMLGLTELGAVAFDKGCYLGQEVVARAQHRGEVKRRLRQIHFRSDTLLPAGATLEDHSGKRVAVVINAAANNSEPSSTTYSALIVTAADELACLQWNYADNPIQLL